MAMSGMQEGEFELKPLPILGRYNRQRYKQWSPEDSAGWYLVKEEDTKEPFAMFPQLGRAHINQFKTNQLIFAAEPRQIYKTIQYSYFIIGNSIIRVDSNWNKVNITLTTQLVAGNTPVYFDYLVTGSIVYAVFTDGTNIYVYQENTNTFTIVTDTNAPSNPTYIATFGNRIAVSQGNSSQFNLSVINLGGNSFNAATCFTIAGSAVFAQANGIIRQMGVLNNTLYIFSDFVTDVWNNTPSVFSGTGVTFPWKQNSTYNWNFGMANPSSLSINFGIMAFLARNSDGLLQFMYSTGGQPERFSDKGIDTLMQRYNNNLGGMNPFLVSNSNGFIYQYENTIFYRMSGGNYTGTGILDEELTANSIEYSFESKTWQRCIEFNGERNRVKYHVYFNYKHLVSVVGDTTVYNMSSQYYYNEIRNPTQTNPQAIDAYLAYPMRYERVTPIVYQKGYIEFETEYAEIDFVFGDSNLVYSTAPFANAQFLVTEQSTPTSPVFIIAENLDSDGQPIFLIGEQGNTPTLGDTYYNVLFKPSIELRYSDDGGISFNSADVAQFSQMGVYQWKMRWYQLGCSRNRVYKLICVSPVPIVILGGVMNVRRVSGGAN